MQGENEQILPPVSFNAWTAWPTASHGWGRSRNTASATPFKPKPSAQTSRWPHTTISSNPCDENSVWAVSLRTYFFYSKNSTMNSNYSHVSRLNYWRQIIGGCIWIVLNWMQYPYFLIISLALFGYFASRIWQKVWGTEHNLLTSNVHYISCSLQETQGN